MPLRKVFVLFLLFVLAVVPGEAKRKHKRLFRPSNVDFLLLAYPDLRAPSRDSNGKSPSLVLQNGAADEYRLPRMLTLDDLARYKSENPPYLVPADAYIDCFEIDRSLTNRKVRVPIRNSKKKREVTVDLRYANADVFRYLNEILAPRYCESHATGFLPFFVSSLVRTEEYQRDLARRNLNAREAIGDDDDDRSAHLTGYAFDIRTAGHTRKELDDLAQLLRQDKVEGYLVEVIVERIGCFHVMVHPAHPYYLPASHM